MTRVVGGMCLPHRLRCVLVFATVTSLTPFSANGISEDQETRPLRLSFLEPTVSFWRSGAEEWVRARLNTPLAPGDHLYASSDGRFEVQIDSEAFVRASHETEFVVETVEPSFVQARLTRGRISVDARSLDDGLTVEINTPGAAFTIDEPGYYRMEVGEQTTDISVLKGGRAEVVLSSGERWPVRSGEQAFVDPASPAPVAIQSAAPADAWDEWNAQRMQTLLAAPSREYLPRGVYGSEALDAHGSWEEEPTYGRIWYPRTVAVDWVPYSLGNWVWDPFFGWTWIDDSPWGWAPFHYGRWVHLGPRWAWAPGPIVTRPFYAPAVVGFYAGRHVGIHIGVAPIGWVALGWGEPILPWWGGRGFVGAPCWRGWGGPRIVNNVVIHNTHVVHVDRIQYVHARERGALVSVTRDRFRHGRIDHEHRLSSGGRSLRPVRGALPLRPTTRALAPRDQTQDVHVPIPARGERPQSIVATRRPSDPTRRLRAAGVRPATRYSSRATVHVAPAVPQTQLQAVPQPEESRPERGVKRPRRPQESQRSNTEISNSQAKQDDGLPRPSRPETRARGSRGTSSEPGLPPGSRQAVGAVPYRDQMRDRIPRRNSYQDRDHREDRVVPPAIDASSPGDDAVGSPAADAPPRHASRPPRPRYSHGDTPPPYPPPDDRRAAPEQPHLEAPDSAERPARSRLPQREERPTRPMQPRSLQPEAEPISPQPMPRSFEARDQAPRYEPRERVRPQPQEPPARLHEQPIREMPGFGEPRLREPASPAMRERHRDDATASRFPRSGLEHPRESRGQDRARPSRSMGKSVEGE